MTKDSVNQNNMHILNTLIMRETMEQSDQHGMLNPDAQAMVLRRQDRRDHTSDTTIPQGL